MVNIFETIKKETSGHQSKIAVIEGDRNISYMDLIDSADKLALNLKDYGIKPLHRVAMLCNDCIDYIIISLAILSVRAVVVPISPSLSWDEADAVLKKIDVNHLIFDKSAYSTKDASFLYSGYNNTRQIFIHSRNAKEHVDKDYYTVNPAFIRFSSGTTGESKGVVLSHEAIIERTDAADKALCMNYKDVVIWVLSMSYHFVVTILLFLRRASTIVLSGSSFPESFIESIKNTKPTFIYASPFHYHLLSNSDDLAADQLSDIRIAVSTAMKLPQETASEFYNKFGFELCEAYGIIEVGLPFVNFEGLSEKRGSAGKVLPDYEIKIENPDEHGVGELFIKGKGMFDAYFFPWKNKKSVLLNGWFKTGDLGSIDNDGFLTISGRDKNVINFTGMKIFPEEVESVLNRHPAVRESLVYGVPNPRFGELPFAKIILKDDMNSDFDTNEIRRFCYNHLPSYKVPKNIIPVQTLEKTASGKLKR
ncbi:MAG: acyl--CoA ligase [Proteobacteria bacterium]|nr:acyl--CoA ligase [Pseudomonadota bacterium]